MAAFLAAWHGCLNHNSDHCLDCKTCDCYEERDRA